ncbi:signal peptidase I [Pradoshia eiseniae]|uniref:Signal peptidase I n=1 Tax=Pradoshia eiseniae TaxID=2064768 RepID=A0A2S7N107_9BACI|nr:signal peptidase I [Pradoshia eiseniae]PQD95771.1 signal peptidase I [Pradoshia eiseniae]
MVKEQGSGASIWSGIKILIASVLLIVMIRMFLLTPYKVEGLSMEPTLHDQEKILVTPVRWEASYRRGEIVVIKGDGYERYVKRVIGLPGDKIEVKGEDLYINDKKWNEAYLDGVSTDDFSATLVPEHCYFVMGDNRTVSMDSRNGLGFIEEERIIGKGKYVFYPFQDMREIQ